jgi:hypothetical protein
MAALYQLEKASILGATYFRRGATFRNYALNICLDISLDQFYNYV